MAGGTGSRFWPLSKTKKPKQFLDILGTGKSLLQQTFSRFAKICPVKRNTAPCIAYSNLKIKAKNPDAVIVTAPSDHLILDETNFTEIIKQCFKFVENNNSLLTLGIKPSRPETGYGYIQIGDEKHEEFGSIHKVKSFTEKPDRETAEKFIESNEFLWNSGIFVWSLKSINAAFDKHLPIVSKLFSDISVLETFEKENTFINEAYAECESISIDKGIMEHADNVYVMPSDFGWSDLGTWDSLYENSIVSKDGNVKNSDKILCFDTENTIIHIPENKLIVVEGLQNYIVAESEKTLLICKRDNEKKIREFVKDVEENFGSEYI